MHYCAHFDSDSGGQTDARKAIGTNCPCHAVIEVHERKGNVAKAPAIRETSMEEVLEGGGEEQRGLGTCAGRTGHPREGSSLGVIPQQAGLGVLLTGCTALKKNDFNSLCFVFLNCDKSKLVL